MYVPKSLVSKNKDNSDKQCESLYKGACVRIRNSTKTFQIIGLNLENNTCWVREWPFDLHKNKTFALKINQITLQTICLNFFTDQSI